MKCPNSKITFCLAQSFQSFLSASSAHMSSGVEWTTANRLRMFLESLDDCTPGSDYAGSHLDRPSPDNSQFGTPPTALVTNELTRTISSNRDWQILWQPDSQLHDRSATLRIAEQRAFILTYFVSRLMGPLESGALSACNIGSNITRSISDGSHISFGDRFSSSLVRMRPGALQ